VTGDQLGNILVFDAWAALQSGGVAQPVHQFAAHGDSVNGISLHPSQTILASTSGQRRFSVATEYVDPLESPVDVFSSPLLDTNSLKLWKAPCQT